MTGLIIALFAVIAYQFVVINNLKKKLAQANGTSTDSSLFGEKKQIVYSWSLDSARKIKLKGHLQLSFNTDEIKQLREANPYFIPNPNKDNVDNLRTMYEYMQSHPRTIKNVAEIVKYINRQCSHNGIGEMDKLQFVLDFVQEPNIKYIHDYDCSEINKSSQYVRFPDETLFDRHGDCDCKSFLAASLFHVMGYNVLFMMSQKLEHAAICIEYDQRWKSFLQDQDDLADVLISIDNRKYVFCETTSDGFRIGGIGQNQSVADFDTVLELKA